MLDIQNSISLTVPGARAEIWCRPYLERPNVRSIALPLSLAFGGERIRILNIRGDLRASGCVDGGGVGVGGRATTLDWNTSGGWTAG